MENENWNQPTKRQKVNQSLPPRLLPTSDFYGKRKTLTNTATTTSSSWLAARTVLRRKWRRLSQQYETEDKEQVGVYTAPPPPWKIHRMQQLAFDEADQHNNTPSAATGVPLPNHDLYRVFSLEVDNKGKRVFLATSLRRFWNYYKKLQRWQRHYYEIIRENKPCRLYFDLEFYYECNPHVESTEQLMEEFFYQVHYELQTVCGICIQRHQFHDMDSSTETKFSRHVTVVLPNDQLWRNNIHVGHFVRRLAQRCRRECPMLWLCDHKDNNGTGGGNNPPLFLADLAVYTKNRAFRLYLSSKVSKGIALMPAETHQPFQPCNLMDEDGEFDYFCHSLTSGGATANRTLTKLSKLYLVHIAGVHERPLEATTKTSSSSSWSSSSSSSASSSSSSSLSSSSSSSYILIDNLTGMEDLKAFIEARASSTGVRSRVRKIERQPSSNEIIFHISGSKYCDNIHRQHKSNHIYYVVNVKDRYYTQKCWDVQCITKGERMHRKLPNELQLPVPRCIEDVEVEAGVGVGGEEEVGAGAEAEAEEGETEKAVPQDEAIAIEIQDGCNFAM